MKLRAQQIILEHKLVFRAPRNTTIVFITHFSKHTNVTFFLFKKGMHVQLEDWQTSPS
jgi:hypothetical protein